MQSQLFDLTTRTHRETIDREIARGLAVVRIPAPLTLSEWADREFYLSGESSAIEGRWETLPWQRDIMDCISNDDIREIDWIKCARVGYTKIILAAAAYFVTHKKRTGAIYQPTDGDAKSFVKSEVDPMIRDVGACREALIGDPEKRGRHNTHEMKTFIAALLYILGGNTGRSYRRLTLDFVAYDELEGFEQDIDDEGDPVSLGDKRISNSPFPKSLRGSTPRLKATSLINGEVQRARHHFRYRVRCLDCREPQALIFAQLRWDDQQPETVRYVCEHCASAWQFADLYQLLEDGFWATDDGHRIKDGQLLDPDGLAIEWPRHIAFHIWAAYSPFFSWRELVEEWLEAVATMRGGDERKLKTFTNTRLAEPWEDRGETVEYGALYARRESYSRPPPGVLLLTCAVDVQDNRLELEVTGWGVGEESWAIEYRVIYGDPQQVEVWDDLEAVINQRYTTEDAREITIAAVGLDTGYLPDHVYAFYRRSRHPRVFCLKGAGGNDKPIVAAPNDRRTGKSRAKVPLFMVGSDVCKTIVYRRLQIAEPGAGYMHFNDTFDEEYFRMLTAEKRVARKRKGFVFYEWIKDRARNEALDIRAMAVAVIAILNPVWEALGGTPPPPPTESRATPPQLNPHAYPRRHRRR